MSVLGTLMQHSQYYFSALDYGATKWIALLGVFLQSAYLILSLCRRKRNNFPPGPMGVPIFGYLPFLGKVHHETIAKLSKKYGPVFSVPLGDTRVVVCNDWESVKDALGKNSTLDRQSVEVDLPFGLGFGALNGQEWLEQRRFSMRVMRDIGVGKPKWEDMLHEEADELLQSLKEHDGNPVDVLSMFESTFTNSMLSLLFGQSFGHSVAEYITKMVDLTMYSVCPTQFSNYFPKLCRVLNFLGLYGYDHREKLREYDQFLRKMVNKHLEDGGTDTENSLVSKYHEELQNKLKSKTKTTLTEVSMHANVQALILGGIETTRTALMWLLIAMAENQEHQHLVHRELDTLAGALRWVDRTRAPYTFACIMESMRWETVSPFILFRATNEDTTIQGYDVPKGTSVTSNNWALHNDPRYWPQPQKFDPTRMLQNDGKQINFKPESYNPFSHGRRHCPGENIAMIELFVYFTKIMQKFKVLPEEGTTVKRNVSIGLTNQPLNFKLRFLPRD